MHRDALAALGESLRREFQDLLHYDAAALADLVEEARQLLETLDSQMQALAAWLTSSSVAAALPSAVPREDVAIEQQTSLAPDSRRALSVMAAHRPMVESGAPLDTSFRAMTREGDLPFVSQTSGTPSLRDTTVRSRVTSPVRVHTALSPAADTVAPERSGAVLSTSSARDSAWHGLVLPDTPSLSAASSKDASNAPQTIEVSGAQGGKADVPMDMPEYAAAPGEVGLPEVSAPAPTAIDTFAPVKNLHDLRRFLATGDHATAVATAGPGNGTASAAAGSPDAGEEHAVIVTEARHLATFSVHEGTSPLVTQEARPVQSPSTGPGNSVQQDMLLEDNRPGAWETTPPQASEPEVDMESLLDTLSRRVAEEYRRFYGST